MNQHFEVDKEGLGAKLGDKVEVLPNTLKDSGQGEIVKLTKRILEAIITMSGVVEAGAVEDFLGDDGAESRKIYIAACEAGTWAAGELMKREEKKTRKRKV